MLAHDLRKGLLNTAACSAALAPWKARGGDLVGWIDDRLAGAEPGPAAPGRAATMSAARLEPLVDVVRAGAKLWSTPPVELVVWRPRSRDAGSAPAPL